MIKEKELQELRPETRYKDGQSVDLQAICAAIQNAAEQSEVPLAFSFDRIKYGGLLGKSEDCLVLYHPEHKKDYFSIAVCVNHQGTYAFVKAYTFGVSKLMKADMVRKQVLATAKVGWDRAGDSHKDYNVLNDAASGAAFIGAGIVGVRNLIKGNSDKQKMEQEQQWYTIINDLLGEVIS